MTFAYDPADDAPPPGDRTQAEETADTARQMAAVNRQLGRDSIAAAQAGRAAELETRMREDRADQMPDPGPASLWDQIVGTAYRQVLLDYGNANSNHGPDQDERLPDATVTARDALVAQLAQEQGVQEWQVRRLADEAARNHGSAHDADYHDYLAEPWWDAVKEGTYQAHDPWVWVDEEPDEDDLDDTSSAMAAVTSAEDVLDDADDADDAWF